MIDFWRNRRVLVTGGTGFLGSELVLQLISRDADVGTIERDWVPRSRYQRETMWLDHWSVNGDVLDAKLVARVVNEYDIDTIFHLAAQAIVGIGNTSPASTYETNIMGTVNVLEAARLSKAVRRVIVASSDKAYGDLPVGVRFYSEAAPLRPHYPYDTSKACADMIARSYAHTYGMDVMVVRCGNLYGPGDLNFDRIVPRTIQRILCGERPQVYGDGETVRDMTHVADAADAYLLIGETPCGDWVRAVNVSGENPLSTREIVTCIANEMGWTDGIEFRYGIPVGIKEQRLDNLSMRRIGWKPQRRFIESLPATINWYKEVLHGANELPRVLDGTPDIAGDDSEPATVPETERRGCEARRSRAL